MEMKRRKLRLGVQKGRPIKKNKRSLLKKVVDYLKSDSYLFAPLICSSVTPPSTGVEKPVEEKNKKKKLLAKVWRYLKSDSYLYFFLVGSPESATITACSPPSATKTTTSPPLVLCQHGRLEKVSGEICKKMTSNVSSQPVVQEENMRCEYPPNPSCRPIETITSTDGTTGHPETIKHMVHRECRISTMQGRGLSRPQLRKLLVDRNLSGRYTSKVEAH
ncbi:hypothetical protein RJ641_025390 [Dillenia turbinata]|uniref:Uncharacterized protein n=1 Tax=Dillenia turbinata TaxID=194707 RepID=A0AAN8W0S7_9MAGN